MYLYNISQTDAVQYNAPAYQEDACCEEEGMWKLVSDITYDKPLNWDDEQGLIFDAAEIAQLLKVREKEVHDDEGEDENEEDDTLFSIAVKMKEVPQLRSTVMMNNYFQLKLQCYFPFCDDFTWWQIIRVYDHLLFL
jgi:hypothetical protein